MLLTFGSVGKVAPLLPGFPGAFPMSMLMSQATARRADAYTQLSSLGMQATPQLLILYCDWKKLFATGNKNQTHLIWLGLYDAY